MKTWEMPEKVKQVLGYLTPHDRALAAAAPEMFEALAGMDLRCRFDPLNPCSLSREPGKHWGGGESCPECRGAVALAGILAGGR